MIWEHFQERIDNGFYRKGDRFWLYEYHFGNIEGKISKHTPPTEVELGDHGELHKVSPKTGRLLHGWVYFYRIAYQEGEIPESYYVVQVFETKEECAEAYNRSIDFWLNRVEEYRHRTNDLLDQQRVYISNYRDKAPQ